MQIRVLSHYLHLPLVVLAAVHSISILVVATLLRGYLRDGVHLSPAPATVGLVVITLIFLTAFGVYSRRQRSRLPGMLLRISLATLLAGATTWVIHRLAAPTHGFPLVDAMLLALVCAGALFLIWVIYSLFWPQDTFSNRVLVFGSGLRAESISGLRRRADRRSFKLVGYYQPDGEMATVAKDLLIGAERSLRQAVDELDIDEVVVAMDDRRRSFPVAALLECRLSGVDITDVASFLERETGRVMLDVLNPSWLIFSDGFRRDATRRFTRRAFDLLAGATLFLLTLPLMLLTILAIKFEDGMRAPVIYRQLRVGMLDRPIYILKFRSMGLDAEKDGVAQWARKNDARITRVGRFIRKVRLDELPQLVNVVRGDMSFVGPRPERPEFVARLSEKIPYYRERHWVKPGITGWAQICYPYGSSEQDAIEKLQYDLYYVKNHNLVFDVMILLQTLETILLGRGAR